MLVGVGLMFLLLVELSCPPAVSSPQCQCSLSQASELQADCSSQKLRAVPHVPLDTVDLDLRDNLLTSIPVGYFDQLHKLKTVHLSGNPFHCDCRIQYLHTWLARQRALVPTCAGPKPLKGRAISKLDSSVFSPCGPDQASSSGAYGGMLGFLLLLVIALLLWSLKLAKDLMYILGIYEKHTGFEAESLRSRKPKHRMRIPGVDGGSSETFTVDDLEAPLLNMELLPQIIDALQKKHNIKIKEI